MNQEEYKKLETIDWYIQGAESVPIGISFPFSSWSKQIADGVHSILYGEGSHMNIFSDKKTLEDHSQNILDQEKKDSGKKLKEFREWQKERSEFQQKYYACIELDISQISDQQLIDEIENIQHDYFNLWLGSIFIDSFDPFDNLLSEKIPYLEKEEQQQLLMPFEPTFVQQYEFELAQIALGGVQKESIVQFAKKYDFISNNYANRIEMTADVVKERMNHLEDPTKTVKEYGKISESYKKTQQELLEKYPKLKNDLWLTDLYSLISIWRDERKAHSQQGISLGFKLIKEIGKRRDIDFETMKFLCWQEMSDCIEGKITKQDLEKRKENHAFLFFNNSFKPEVLTGPEAKKIKDIITESINSKHTEIKGMVACKGAAKGKVRVIHAISEFEKMEQGDILVAAMTRPEFLPIMKKAAGIITDEGGLTCHAAVVSREFGIPCIIGTQIATTTLKDGDIVEFDTENGLIKKV